MECNDVGIHRFSEFGGKFLAQAEDGQTAQFWHEVLVRADQLIAFFPAPVQTVADGAEDVLSTGNDATPEEALSSQSHVRSATEEQQPIERGGEVTNPQRSHRGAPSLASNDTASLERMRFLLTSEEVESITKAANIVVAEGGVAGVGSDESKAKRLARRYGKASSIDG